MCTTATATMARVLIGFQDVVALGLKFRVICTGTGCGIIVASTRYNPL